jgi:hypothetical protein
VKKASLVSKLGKISTTWKQEKDMYPDIIEAMTTTFYAKEAGVFVVDTHNKGDFRPDVHVSDYKDRKNVVFFLRYFIEFKLPSIDLITPDHCGQVVDYFHKTHEKPRHRREFNGILSNL